MGPGSSFRVRLRSISTTSEGSSSGVERSLPVCEASLAGLFSGGVSEGSLVSLGVLESEVGIFTSLEVDGMEEGWAEELSKVSIALVGLLGLTVAGGLLLVPGSIKRGAGDLGLADFLRSSSIVEGADLLGLELLSLELVDLLALLRLLEDFPFLAILKTWKSEMVDYSEVAGGSWFVHLHLFTH